MSNSVRTIRNKDLAPTWTVKQAKEPGFMRSLITWVGGPDGYINTNPEVAVISQSAAVGLMRMAVGNRQAGVHIHSITEIYVILKGEVESFDGVGNLHRAYAELGGAPRGAPIDVVAALTDMVTYNGGQPLTCYA